MQTIKETLGSIINWVDQRGRGAWICIMVLGFIFFWPFGLAILFFLLWSNRMGKKKHWRRMSSALGLNSTGNTAFESYKHETIERLRQEQDDFKAFLERLRQAKDKSEFDQFMAERERHSSASA